MKIDLRTVLRFLSIGFIFLAGAQASAYTDKVAWLGGQYGLSIPSESSTNARSAFGITGGAKVGSEFGVGAYYLSSHNNETINNVSQPWNYDLYGVMAAYFFEGEARGVHLGVMLGMSKLGAQYPQNATGTTYSASPMHYGLVAGYDYWFLDQLSIGGEISYISVQAASASVNSVSFNTDTFSTLNFMLALKFWL